VTWSREIANEAPMVRFEASLGILAPGWQDSSLSLITTPRGNYSPPLTDRSMDRFDDSWLAPTVEDFLSNAPRPPTSPRTPASPRTPNTSSYAGRHPLSMSPRSPKAQSPRGSFLMQSRDEPSTATLRQTGWSLNAYSPMLTASNTPLVSAPNSVYALSPPVSAPPSPRGDRSQLSTSQGLPSPRGNGLPSPRLNLRGDLGAKPPAYVSPRSAPKRSSGVGSAAAAKPPTPKPRTAARPVRAYIPETHF
jgi:hypothetical protein